MIDDPPITPERSSLMARVRPRDTKPEMIVRRVLHALGYRFRLQAKELPGRPDIVFRPRKKAIFVHGCFWHRHPGCRRTTSPKSRREFWEAKFSANQARDERVQEELKALGWSSLVIWECETRNSEALAESLKNFLN
ncbi:very short patch repair endonuclease [Agrobacterium sp. a22-2]|uniref:very short patch repair endonuclease n=1 Tax=Agrobacterium sp. a22-2 TaxID=2283840 RepID=UPI0034CDCB6A